MYYTSHFLHITHESCINVAIHVCGWCQAIYSKSKYQALFFLLYINDLYNVCSTSVPLLYTDDTNLFYKGKDIDTLVRGINFELGNISTWLKVNKLSLNVKKNTLYAI